MKYPVGVFERDENVFVEGSKDFFEFAHFCGNAVIRADKVILDWRVETFQYIGVDIRHKCACFTKSPFIYSYIC